MAHRRKLGDIYAIPLPDGTFAFCRVLQAAAAAFYRQRGKTETDLPNNEDYEFVVTVYNYSYKKWKFVIHRPFECEDESWAPPRCWVDQIAGQGSLYFKGERTPCTYEECKDLEILAVWDGEQVIDRLMEEHKWERVMKKPVPCG